MNTDDNRSRVPWARLLALTLMVGGCIAFVRANNAEANAIFDAGGDAGMWDLGVVFLATMLAPGAVLLLISLAIRPRTDRLSVVAMIAGLAVAAPAALLAVGSYPPSKVTYEGRPLNPAQWNHFADLYLLAFLLLGAAGVLLVVSAFPWRSRQGSLQGLNDAR